MKRAPFIAVEGPIGAGKTTLASMLSETLSLSLVKEIVEENPFLGKFYEDKDEWSFQLEMFFLCNRYKQLEDTEKEFLHKNKPVISDYHIYKNLIFAERTLTGRKLEKYRKIYGLLTEDLPKPNIIIYIRASLPTLLKRIKKRGRSFEQQMDEQYLEQLIKDYETAINQIKEAEPTLPIIEINGDQDDFVLSKEVFQRIADQVKEYIQ
ncbi:deoxyguanosine kinase [Bacillus glycinifermentans]|uniref:Deoxyguanosine kinase n=1 Tax=Bacillus glycinifermentans TaxID=1664069 RepID=A0A0J6E3Q4_9BACI|nr:deoxynucleoside kinase [Bacillus glycinifermentans]ATH93955.1 deoxynucleoside kinase [Bacillus glycinifermentans]KMM55206.1 deoxyguanosine kinase [Bacillus glycinifermentans]KRT94103.1 deoxyguanosine kinase [Bacillus glycinifermentans]MEC0488003.1 deoxynucleoside kinase [Bacillus glycinifermentans]MEC0496507.1 deoxynucleoside kinase [Bacillus glycinifermentans]